MQVSDPNQCQHLRLKAGFKVAGLNDSVPLDNFDIGLSTFAL